MKVVSDQMVKTKRVAGGALALLLVLVPIIIAGCSEPQAIPIANRAPGKDISAEERAAKRGDNPIRTAN